MRQTLHFSAALFRVTVVLTTPFTQRQGFSSAQHVGELTKRQGHPEPTGAAKITAGYNLPARHVLHTVGPIVHGALTEEHRQLLASCYRSCLTLAAKNELKSVAFCCISTGEFHFPNDAAAEIAVREVRDFLTMPSSIERVVFNVFKDDDRCIYERLLL